MQSKINRKGYLEFAMLHQNLPCCLSSWVWIAGPLNSRELTVRWYGTATRPPCAPLWLQIPKDYIHAFLLGNPPEISPDRQVGWTGAFVPTRLQEKLVIRTVMLPTKVIPLLSLGKQRETREFQGVSKGETFKNQTGSPKTMWLHSTGKRVIHLKNPLQARGKKILRLHEPKS